MVHLQRVVTETGAAVEGLDRCNLILQTARLLDTIDEQCAAGAGKPRLLQDLAAVTLPESDFLPPWVTATFRMPHFPYVVSLEASSRSATATCVRRPDPRRSRCASSATFSRYTACTGGLRSTREVSSRPCPGRPS